MSRQSIKSRYRSKLYGFVALMALVMFAEFSGSGVLQAGLAGKWAEVVRLDLVLTLVLPLTTLVLDGIVPADLKAVLVYWKWSTPLPGHEAFTVHGPRDIRVDMGTLETRYGPLPTKPAAQNQLWYRLSKAAASYASVDEAHGAWLFARDLTSLSLALFVTNGCLAVVLGTSVWVWIALIGEAVLYVMLRQVAANSGVRLVTTVLAESAARE